MENNNIEKMKYEAAKEHVARIRKFVVSLLIFCILFLLFYGSDLFSFNELNFGFGRIL
jgi:hypothetical protein